MAAGASSAVIASALTRAVGPSLALPAADRASFIGKHLLAQVSDDASLPEAPPMEPRTRAQLEREVEVLQNLLKKFSILQLD